MDSKDCMKRKKNKNKKKRKKKHLFDDINGDVNPGITDDPIKTNQFNNIGDCTKSITADGLSNCNKSLKMVTDGYSKPKKRKKKVVVACNEIKTEIDLTPQFVNKEVIINKIMKDFPSFQDEVNPAAKKKKKKKIKSLAVLDANSATDNAVSFKHNSILSKSTKRLNDDYFTLNEQEVNSSGIDGNNCRGNCGKYKIKKSILEERKNPPHTVGIVDDGKVNNVDDSKLRKNNIAKAGTINVTGNREKDSQRKLSQSESCKINKHLQVLPKDVGNYVNTSDNEVEIISSGVVHKGNVSPKYCDNYVNTSGDDVEITSSGMVDNGNNVSSKYCDNYVNTSDDDVEITSSGMVDNGNNVSPKYVNNYVNTSDNDVEVTSSGMVDNGNNEEDQEDWFSPLHYVNCGDNYKQLPSLQKKGIFPKMGKWEPAELAQLEKNMKDYLEEYPIKDISHLIYPRTKEEKKFRNKTQFNLRMCKGIRRIGTRIYFKVECYFSNFLTKGRYSTQEKMELKNLHNVHGNKWKTIGLLMNRDYHSLDVVHSHFFSPSKGRWNNEEDDRLIKAVNTFRKNNEKIVWAAVSKIVGTRSLTHCVQRWRSQAIRDQVNGLCENIIFDKKDILKMITVIFESGVDDYYLIDWNELSQHFNDSVSPMWCKWKFGVICKEVPRSHLLEFEEIIDQLHEIYIRKVDENDCNDPVIVKDSAEQ